jgi:hypothetical protein
MHYEYTGYLMEEKSKRNTKMGLTKYRKSIKGWWSDSSANSACLARVWS